MKNSLNNSSKENKVAFLNKELSNLSKFEEKLTDICQMEFEEKIVDLLKLNDREFMQSFEKRMRLILEDIYSSSCFKNYQLNNLLKDNIRRIYEEYYKQHAEYVQGHYKPNKKNNTKIRFNKHCKNSSDTPIHTCNGYFYPITDDNGEILYLVCMNCEMVYLSSSVFMTCEVCDTDYFTAILKTTDNMDLVPATWDKYHCSALINDKMRCINCQDYLYLKVKTNTLICQSCDFEADPKSILWICMLCHGEFKTGAKMYNKLEFKLIKLAIKEALLNKENSKPSLLPCCNKKDLSDVSFFHKKDCDGLIFQSDLIKGRKIVVCEKCKMMNDYEKFVWICPLCFKRFKQKDSKKKDEIRKSKRSETEKTSNNNINKGEKEKEVKKNSKSTTNTPDLQERIDNEAMNNKKKISGSAFSASKSQSNKESDNFNVAPSSPDVIRHMKNPFYNIKDINDEDSKRDKTPPKGGVIKLLDHQPDNLLNIHNQNFANKDKSKIFEGMEAMNNNTGSTRNTNKKSSLKEQISKLYQ